MIKIKQPTKPISSKQMKARQEIKFTLFLNNKSSKMAA